MDRNAIARYATSTIPCETGQLLWRLSFALILGCLWLALTSERQTFASERPPRVPWTTSRVAGSPEPALPFTTELAFPHLEFENCLDLAAMPGSDRLFVVEQGGKILSFPNRGDVQRAELVIDLAKDVEGAEQCYAITFDPDFELNRYCYVCYVQQPDQPHGTHVARYQVRRSEPPVIDVASERTIITWLSGGHNGCCLKFGPDGCLYISAGDAGPANPPDPLRAGQDLSNVLSTIMRVDVRGDDFPNDDRRNYRVPTDNPFLERENTRGEIWAYGLRNPWRMSFDRVTGDLWVGDVGWELWEMIYRVERGGNYGWAITEGRQPVHPEWPRGPTAILSPVIDHPHSESSSITDGFTYYGDRLPELRGTHIYGDFDTGKFWGFRFEEGQVTEHRELADTTLRVVGFGEDHDGELYVIDHAGSAIHRLIRNPMQDASSQFPRTLSATGLFRSVAELVPAPGVVRYSINAQPWADHAQAQRWIAIPGGATVQPGEPAWSFPDGTVLVKTLSLERDVESGATPKRVETQILHYDGIAWQPYTYQWNDEQTDATLVGAMGADVDLIDQQASDTGAERRTWRFAGRAECQRCHNRWSGPPLGFNSPQLDRPDDVNESTNQLELLADRGIVAPSLATGSRTLVDPHDATKDVTDRARSYLHVNCAHCHRTHAGSAVLSKMPFDLPLSETDMVNVRPTQGAFGIHDAKVIAPGDPYHSIIWYRMAKMGSGRMPYIGSTEVDRAGLKLVHDWILDLASDDSTAPGAALPAVAASASEIESRALSKLRMAETSSPPPTEAIAQLLDSPDRALRLVRAIDEGSVPESVEHVIVSQATQLGNSTIRDLFEGYLPRDQRVKRLSGRVSHDQILGLPGDKQRGKMLFFETAGIQCKNCHRVERREEQSLQDGQAVDLGPNLTRIGASLDRRQLLDSILEPSKKIDPPYITYVVETKSGIVLTGLLLSKSEETIVLRDIQGKITRVAAAEVEQLVPQPQSLMPEMLLQDLTAQQAADLVEYLSTLK